MPYNTEADIATFVNTVWEDALLVARDNNIMSGLVRGFGDRQGLALRKNAKYGTAVWNQVTETDDPSSQAFTPATDQTLTPYEYGAQFFITDSRIETDIWEYRQDAAIELGASYGQKIDAFLSGLFSSMTGGTVGAAGTNLSWANVFAAITKARRPLIPEPWVMVLTPELWHCLGTAIAPGATVSNSPMLQDELVTKWFVGRVSGVDIFTTANITAGTSVYGGLFNRAHGHCALHLPHAGFHLRHAGFHVLHQLHHVRHVAHFSLPHHAAHRHDAAHGHRAAHRHGAGHGHLLFNALRCCGARISISLAYLRRRRRCTLSPPTSRPTLEKVIDRLLANPMYGERWGRHWLDTARYSDTKGEIRRRSDDPYYPHAWTYRDYVIRAFNTDKPYDQFVKEQIAADKLPEGQADKSTLAALGFLTLGEWLLSWSRAASPPAGPGSSTATSSSPPS